MGRPRKSWGLGGYEYEDEYGEIHTHYGYPPRNICPLKYWPDSEVCTKEEIRRWKAAKRRKLKKGPTAVEFRDAILKFQPTVPLSFIVSARRAARNR